MGKVTRIALVSTPWPLFNRPSIQLGALKAFLCREVPNLEVDAFHPYLAIAAALGYDVYREIADRTWPAESLYAALLYPDRRAGLQKFWQRQVRHVPILRRLSFEELLGALDRSSARFMDGIEWDRLSLAGFSICLGQLTSSLFFIREIKRKSPNVLITAGGSSCAGDMGSSLLRAFPEIDFVVQGEGERPLVHLAQHLGGGAAPDAVPPCQGLIGCKASQSASETFQVDSLDDLPYPDFADYFKELGALPPSRRFFPRLPMEISRGCWWRGAGRAARSSGCAFCNLNLQWWGYRAKSRQRILDELDALTGAYQDLSVSFMDNLLPARELAEIFDGIQGLGRDFRLFGEIRARTPLKALRAMGMAGVREVQVGIESLSTRLLERMHKGTRAIDNLEIMKHCEACGYPDLAANLILEFPSSGEAEVAETLMNLDFALPFRPLRGISFWLGYGSPVHADPERYGIGRVRNHPFYARLFPSAVLQDLKLMVQGYSGGVLRQRRLWRPVREKIKAWHRSYQTLHGGGEGGSMACEPILSYLDGRDFMIIRERQPGAFQKTHRLKGLSRDLYLFCDVQRSLRAILTRFSGLGEEHALPFLRMMVEKRLMFNEDDRYLSLAVRCGPLRKG
ncbi:RiPP maturation radical SAM C-methyltransferase [Desulfatiglans anilini]|uniref:RiPP maturation radical SAM C-methyltransferase n=1 Tax=Desulfatiglans anilini TaxID=90728 RepID=UPI000486C68B|nr:RiPP maturation radical SAM C-methyltransferase [Desulfatiglans anilini]